LTLVPHGSGTHTETVGHVLPGTIVLGRDVPFPPALMAAVVLTVSPTVLSAPLPDYPASCAGDAPLAASARQGAFAAAAHAHGVLPTRLQEALAGGAVVVRTLPNDDSKQLEQWSGKNPPVGGDWMGVRAAHRACATRASAAPERSTFPQARLRGSFRLALGSEDGGDML
jgi:membrane-bound lytic murein transglycosylase B